MILEYKKILSFICPDCSYVNICNISVFNVNSKKKLDIACINECDNYCVRIEQRNDKYKISVQCPICCDIHVFSIKKSMFWQKNFMLKCPYSMIDICCAGSKDYTAAQIDKIQNTVDEFENTDDKEIAETIRDLFDIRKIFDDSEGAEADLPENIMERLCYLTDNNRIYCKCGGSHIQADTDDFYIKLQCLDCGYIKTIEITEDFLSYILENSTFTIR